MSRSFGKDVEYAVNSVVEALVRRMFEVNERLRQKESELLKLHKNTVNEIEKNILQTNAKQNFLIENASGLFKIEGLQNDKIVMANDEKKVFVELSNLESNVKPVMIENTKNISDNISSEVNKYVEKLKGMHNGEINKLVSGTNAKISEIRDNIQWSENVDYKSMKGKELEVLSKQYDAMKEAEKISQEKTIDKIPDDKNEILESKITSLTPSHVRGQMEALKHLKSLSDKEIINNFKNAEKQAKIEGRPVAEVYKENLVKQVNIEVQISKEKTLNVAIYSFGKNNELRENLRSIQNEINKNTGVLYQAKIENKIPLEEYNKMKVELDIQKEQINDRLMKINQNEHKMNEQLKVDLKQQFPEMKTDNLKINETIGLAKAAYTMTNKNTIENLRNFSLENDLKSVIHSIDKTTKEIEIEISEITETISR